MMDAQPRYLNVSFPKNAKVLYQEALRNTEVFSTGCPGLDNLLDGGLWTGEVLEIYGIAGAGKTQFCKTVCASLLEPRGKSALYYDASGSFVGERLLGIVANRNEPCTHQFLEDALSRIKYLRILDAQSLLVELRRLDEKLTVTVENFFCEMKLLIVDGINSLISPILGGGQAQGHMLMMEIGRILKKIAVKHNIACIVVNGAVVDTDPQRTSSHKPALGKSWKSVPHVRLYFEVIDVTDCVSKNCIAVLSKSSRQEVGRSEKFCITSNGLECLNPR